MTTAWEQYTEVRNQCFELKQQGKWLEQIPLQKKVIELAEPFGAKRVANAWAKLAHLYHQTRQYDLAEKASLTALSHHDDTEKHPEEHLATLQFQLATILAAQERFDEAVKIGTEATKNFAVFHDPPTDFLRARVADVEEMRRFRDRKQTRDNKRMDSNG